MKLGVKAAFDREMADAQSAEAIGDIALAKHHLERAHILGQRWYAAHVKPHFHMLRLALKQPDTSEARGQLVRRIGAAPFPLAGWVPDGNTRGADVSPTMPMPIPPDLQFLVEGHSLRNGLILRGAVVAALVAAYLLFGR
ncbi:DUF3703 domain-containing protein [Sphingopyxis sp.]|mgnify:CR=1 FL=1|jgi:hypothetical protein|uniref:DUF3703 domain-containing protein n=1 Tax=Sphingopyxis sp. TaxID=1908224 RepID=UPI0025D61981|nr:DUF3703 domain-containing protein [Sphingopyxis sp.]MBK6414577.1 DUF3703 domain-containing protein [Sphingopyxis sp.]